MAETLELLEVELKPSFESCYSLEAAVIDEKQRTVAVTLISVGPGNQRDKNFYSMEAISKAAPMFEGTKCFANHPSALDAKIQPERKVQDIVGWFSEVKVDGEALKATLHVISGENAEWAWPLVKEAISYAKKYPGRNLAGLSINARGAQEPLDLNGEQWKKVTQFLEVRSVDLVTEPARGGKMEQVLTENEAVASSAADIFTALKQKIREGCDAGLAGHEDLRRMTDQLGTELKFNKAEEGEDMADKGKKSSAIDFDQMGETFKKMAEGESDNTKKEAYSKASEAFVGMAKSKKEAESAEAEKEAEAKKKESEAKGKEAESEAEAKKESKKKEGESKKESEYQVKYIDLKRQTLLSESGLTESQKDFALSTLLEGVDDEEKMESIVNKYAAVCLEESGKRLPHNFSKTSTVKTQKLSAAEKLSAAIN